MAITKTTYEAQARLSVGLAIIGGLATLAGAYFILGRFDYQTFLVNYNPQGKRIIAIALSLLIGLAASGIGFFVGLNSAGQRLNKRNRLSWTGFFLSAAVVALTLSCGFFFYLTKNAVLTLKG